MHHSRVITLALAMRVQNRLVKPRHLSLLELPFPPSNIEALKGADACTEVITH